MIHNIESLPPEIRTHILSMVELEGLKRLVHASPVYHQQYLLFRKSLLFQSLENTMKNITLEACAVHQSSLKTFSEARTRENVTQFFHSFRERQLCMPNYYAVFKRKFTLDDVIHMVNFHCLVIKPLVQRYADWALGNLVAEPEASSQIEPHKEDPLSKTEEARVTRALYRFELCCNLFGLGRHKVDLGSYLTKQRLGFEATDILMLLEDSFEPWEIEELSCIDTFTVHKCKEIFDKICWDVDVNNPKFGDAMAGIPNGTFDLSGSNGKRMFLCLLHCYNFSLCSTPTNWILYVYVGVMYMKGIITRGLEFLQTIFFKAKDHSSLVSTMQQALTPMYSDFIGGTYYGAFDCASQDERRERAPSERDAKEKRRDPLPFQGDKAFDPDGVYPPLAWTLLWNGSYSNMVGSFVGNALPYWGYVMWDSRRLRRTGAEDVLARQWRMRQWYSNGDPREMIHVVGPMTEVVARASSE